ncbi:MAG: hypothetical protein IH886_08955 [Nitrospinae bacterium]|nr:hypothetical protein [Nitrospinota bacterium]
MSQVNLKRRSVLGLMQMHADILEELKRRRVIRSKNNPVGDYTEWLVSKKLGLKLASNSTTGFDGMDSKKVRYQIKGRRITPNNKSRQLSTIRNMSKKPFDFLIGVIYDQDYKVICAAQIPHKVVSEIASYRKYVNSHIMHLREGALQDERIKDLTRRLASKI